MRRIVVSEFVTLDGVMEDPGGAEGFDEAAGRFSSNAAPTATSSSSTMSERQTRSCSDARRTRASPRRGPP